MTNFGWKAFLRAISIFASVALLKYAVDFVLETNNATVQILYSIGALLAIVLIFVLTNAIAGDALSSLFDNPIAKYVVIITFTISFLLILQAIVDGTERDGLFLSMADKLLAINFVEWFGVLYGFLLPTILVRVWEQFDQIDNVLDREADAVEILAGDLQFLDEQYNDFKKNVLSSLETYSLNVIRFVNKEITPEYEGQEGDRILKQIRTHYMDVFRTRSTKPDESDVLKDELLTQLNNIIDYRGDRISLSTQRLFESLNFVAVVTSLIWLVPFYFLYFLHPETNEELQLGIFGWMLVILVTFLIIVILSIIDDLDKPFDGYWTVNITSWTDLAEAISKDNKEIQSPVPSTNLPQEPNDINPIIPSVPPQPEISKNDKERLPFAIPASITISTINEDFQEGSKSKPNGKKPKQEKEASSLAPSKSKQMRLTAHEKRQKRTKKNSSSEKKVPLDLPTQSESDLFGSEEGKKAMPFE